MKKFNIGMILPNPASLAESSGLQVVMTDEQKDFLNMLEPLNVEARYPTYKEKCSGQWIPRVVLIALIKLRKRY